MQKVHVDGRFNTTIIEGLKSNTTYLVTVSAIFKSGGEKALSAIACTEISEYLQTKWSVIEMKKYVLGPKSCNSKYQAKPLQTQLCPPFVIAVYMVHTGIYYLKETLSSCTVRINGQCFCKANHFILSPSVLSWRSFFFYGSHCKILPGIGEHVTSSNDEVLGPIDQSLGLSTVT